MRYVKVFPLAAMALALACSNDVSDPDALNPGSPSFAGGVAGASFTTTNPNVDGAGHCKNGNEAVNCNIYDGKNFVWLSGGPGTSALADGEYFFAVLAPGGQGGNENPNDGTPDNLSDVSPTTNTGAGDAFTNRVFTLTAGVITSYLGTHTFSDNKIRLMPYDDTPNPGGVYILAICAMPHPAAPSSCKYDAFKVKDGGGGEEQGDPEMSGLKYYDANKNGQYDAGEVGIPGWEITWEGTPNPIVTGADGTFDVTGDPGTYHFAEKLAGNGWTQTGNTVDQTFSFLNSVSLSTFVYTVTAVGDGVTIGLNFGNVCQKTPGGHTMGFWSNKNGQDLIDANDLAALVALNLRNANGTAFNPANKGAYKTWLLAANATNMAYMLSAQLSATVLSVRNGFTDPNVLVDFSVDPPRTVAQLIVYADGLLAADGVTLSGDANRAEQERVKNILDRINNGLPFAAPTLEDALEICGTPTFAP